MKSILIADDDIVAVRLFEMHVRRAGYEPIIFQDGVALLRGLDLKKPTLAILDYDLPGHSGLEIIEHFKKTEALKNVPIIVVTGFMKKELKDTLEAAGADRVFSKPFSPIDLIKNMKELIGDA